ncbi:hypothetical protein TL16_g05334 [Triparma laevis f. inornata]|uniref:Uncharacterized protein n=1 Tax=Triparma laevis f. inornata TaxID=1714386 RepID=A0A9W7AD64_9STRA|nr:hypothetical protein TL16_g05334 [Triparma laevis f. inornata]
MPSFPPLNFTYSQYVVVEPVVGGSYPIVISVASEKAKKFAPLMSMGLKTLCFIDKVGGLARCFGLPAPEFMNKQTRGGLAEKFVGSINEKSTVAGFDVLQSAVDE